METQRLSYAGAMAALPVEWQEDLLPQIRARVRESQRKLVVLDDDPTGTQTVHGVAVLTTWSAESIAAELRNGSPALYLLTNTRSLPQPEATALNRQIAAQLQASAAQARRDFAIVSRSDSTLRGHFPAELDALEAGLGEPFDAWILAPYFHEGGRYTIDNTHYVAEGEWLVPAGETQFARDRVFGYQNSRLPEWVQEKTGGRIPSGSVHIVSIRSLRQEGPQAVTEQILALPKGAVCIVNAASDRDLEVLVLALLAAEAAGRRYLYRTAASFVRVRAGIAPRPLLQPGDLRLRDGGAGLVIVGSYVPKTTAQLRTLIEGTGILPVEVPVEQLLDKTTRAEEIERAIRAADHSLSQGRDTVIYTSRQLISADGDAANLNIGRIVSDSLVQVVRRLEQRPRYLLAKGGITSSDTAVHGLGIRRAEVLGQILPGVPVWLCGPESKYPGMPYIVFPGNVGGEDALAEVVRSLSKTNRGE